MTKSLTITLGVLLTIMTSLPSFAQRSLASIQVSFYGDTLRLSSPTPLTDFADTLTTATITQFEKRMDSSDYHSLVKQLLAYKSVHQPDDWLYYQLIRKTAQKLSPKNENYIRYTLYKWYLLNKSGYEAILTMSGNKLLFYVRSDENVYNIPTRVQNGKQYVCLNYHDYDPLQLEGKTFNEVTTFIPEGKSTFSYRLTRLPAFDKQAYTSKQVQFSYNNNTYNLRFKINPEIKSLFANYPVVDYASYFTAPLSTETYQTLIHELKKAVKGLNQKNGVDYLMRFTRYAFPYKGDSEAYGAEKRLLAEQTLLYEGSDCEDRAALFFYLVKEIYNLPMVVLSFPKHVTVAVQLDKPVGHSIVYQGRKYSICEPTPQREDLSIGELSSDLKTTPFEISFSYTPIK